MNNLKSVSHGTTGKRSRGGGGLSVLMQNVGGGGGYFLGIMRRNISDKFWTILAIH